MDNSDKQIVDLALQLKTLLADNNLRVVFAESCTAGRVAATMAEVPGVSEVLCGSFVTYRELSKVDWLQVPSYDLAKHSAVSQVVTSAMAEGALIRTRESSLAVAITGHLGPSAPEELDGKVFLAGSYQTRTDNEPLAVDREIQLENSERSERLIEATESALAFCIELIQNHGDQIRPVITPT